MMHRNQTRVLLVRSPRLIGDTWNNELHDDPQEDIVWPMKRDVAERRGVAKQLDETKRSLEGKHAQELSTLDEVKHELPGNAAESGFVVKPMSMGSAPVGRRKAVEGDVNSEYTPRIARKQHTPIDKLLPHDCRGNS